MLRKARPARGLSGELLGKKFRVWLAELQTLIVERQEPIEEDQIGSDGSTRYCYAVKDCRIIVATAKIVPLGTNNVVLFVE